MKTKFAGHLPVVEQHARTCTLQKKTSVLKPPSILKNTARNGESLEERQQIQEVAHTTLTAPPLKSIYLRWRRYRNSSVLLNSDRIKAFFMPYGPVERVIFCSETSAIVVFKLVRSACIAGQNASKQLVNYRINATWLPDYLQVPMKKGYAAYQNNSVC